MSSWTPPSVGYRRCGAIASSRTGLLMDTLDGGSTSKSVAGRIQVIAGRITEVGEASLILGSTDRIFLIDGLASGFHPGQRVTITAVLVNGKLTAQQIV